MSRLAKARNRVVSFRVSDEEHQALMEVCVLRGYRSVAELARFAIRQEALQDWETRRAKFWKAIDDLATKLEALEERVESLADMQHGP